MSEVDTGGPAFPAHNFVVPQDLEARHVHKLGQTMGMTLRDYFAAKAMQALVANVAMGAELHRLFDPERKYVKPDNKGTPHEYVAAVAYSLADAMLKVRGEVK